jgi:hypothetical protein
MPPTPLPRPTPSPTAPPPNVFPFDSALLLVLDDPISSKSSKAGEVVRAHLKNAIVVSGHVVAPAGTSAKIRIVDISPSDIMDVYGFVDIFLEPLQLPDGRVLPLRAPVARLAPGVSAGHESTVEAEDTVGDIFVPYYVLYQIFRKGKNFVLRPGSEIPARSEATITAQPNGTIAIATPRPLEPSLEVPNATFPVVPVATPFGPAAEEHHRRGATPRPSASPSPAASAASGASPSPSPSQTP